MILLNKTIQVQEVIFDLIYSAAMNPKCLKDTLIYFKVKEYQ